VQAAQLAAALLLLAAVARSSAHTHAAAGSGGAVVVAGGDDAEHLTPHTERRLRCYAPPAAVEACLRQRQPASACLELAAYTMARLTSAGDFDSRECAYLALATASADFAPNTGYTLALGLLLSQRSAALPLALMRFDAAAAPPRLQALEAQLQAELRQLYANATDSAFFASSEFVPAVMRAAEILDLFGCVRAWAFGTEDAAAVEDDAQRMVGEHRVLRAVRQRELAEPARALADVLLLRQGDAAAYEARAAALLAALDVPSMGDCAQLAARMQRCMRAHNNDTHGSFADTTFMDCVEATRAPLRRAMRLTPMDDCASAVVASSDDEHVLCGFLLLFGEMVTPPAAVPLMLPPPYGSAPHAKSTHALRRAHEAYRLMLWQQVKKAKANPAGAAAPQTDEQQAGAARASWSGWDALALGCRLLAAVFFSGAAVQLAHVLR
jgi:hypothetical protein